MAQQSKTAMAAMKAVAKSESSKKAERTPEQRLKDIRLNLAARLAVTPEDQRWLLEQYDSIKSKYEMAMGDLRDA